MHPDDLNVIWQCRECGRGFLFRSDICAHEQEFRHKKIAALGMPSSPHGKVRQFVEGQLAIDFKVEGTPARMTILYRHFPTGDQVVYQDVKYSDERLRQMIESQPMLMRNIDSYLRSKLSPEQYKPAH